MSRVGFIVLALALAGCGRLSFSAIGTADAGDAGVMSPDADLRTYGGFGSSPEEVAISVADPQLSADGLEIWCAAPDNDYRIQHAFRDQTTDTFMPLVQELWSLDDTEPQLTEDGLTLMFLHGGTINVATRTQKHVPFSSPQEMTDFSGIGSYDLSPSGLVIYYEVGYGSGVFRRRQRSSMTAPFQPATEETGLEKFYFISISPDERLAFGNDLLAAPGTQMRWANRATTDAPWVDQGVVRFPECEGGPAGDPDISPDGTHLIIRCAQLEIYSR